MTLNRDDILKAVKINRLLDHVDDPGSTDQESEAYRRKALQLAKRYRNSGKMSRLPDEDDENAT